MLYECDFDTPYKQLFMIMNILVLNVYNIHIGKNIDSTNAWCSLSILKCIFIFIQKSPEHTVLHSGKGIDILQASLPSK